MSTRALEANVVGDVWSHVALAYPSVGYLVPGISPGGGRGSREAIPQASG